MEETSKNQVLFYSKPYVTCEACLRTPLKCKNCLFQLINKLKTTQNPPYMKPSLQPPFYSQTRHKKPLLRASLNDVLDIAPKVLIKPLLNDDLQKKLKKTDNNDFLPRLPQKVFNHKYMLIPEGNVIKRKVVQNTGAGTELFIRLKEQKLKRTKGNIRLFYQDKEKE